MNRRGFLSASAVVGAGSALAGVNSLWERTAFQSESPKMAGAKLVPEVVAPHDLGGGLPFVLSRFAEHASLISSSSQSAKLGVSAGFSPLHEVAFRGFAKGAGTLANDWLQVVAVHHTIDGAVARHDLWSYAPSPAGSVSSSPVMFTTHDLAFGGFEVTQVSASGARKSALFGFNVIGNGPALRAGVYVLAGPRAATGSPPELGRYSYSGDMTAPVRESRDLGLDFPYLSFVVHSELI